VVCHACGHGSNFEASLGRQDLCPECRAYLHCCMNCRFYDPSAYNECRETMAERVVEKETANFCDYFEAGESGNSGQDEREAAKQALAGLFKKKGV